MLELLVASALRSMVLGGAAWLGLTLTRVRDPQVHMTAWTVVLLVSLAMPMLTPWVRVTIPAEEPPARLVKITWTNVPGETPRAPTKTVIPAVAASQPDVVTASRPDGVAMSQPEVVAAPPARGLDWLALAAAIYVVVAGVMLLRLFIGSMLMWRVVRAAHPLPDGWAFGAGYAANIAANADVRVSDVVVVPVTFASTILLPSASSAWSARKRQAVLLHEGAHVAHGDFYVLLLAAINRAVFWFNPFAWWLLAHLADLAEAISDDAAVAELNDRHHYADILLDVANSTQRLPAGLTMARPSTVRQRVERILAATGVPARISWRKRLLIATALAPLAALSAATIARSAAPMQVAPLTPAAPMSVDPPMEQAQLDRYVGRFQINVTLVVTVTQDNGQLFAQLTGEQKQRLMGVHDNEFVNEHGDANVTFVTNGDGPATEIMLREPNIGSRRGARIDAAKADEIEATFQRRTAAAPDRFRDQTPLPGAKAALRQTIEDVRRGVPSYERMSPQLGDKLRQQLPWLHTVIGTLGAVESIFFRGVGPGGYDIYGVKFANGSAEFRVDLAPSGRIDDVNFNPSGDGTIGGVADCALEPTLRPSRDDTPIRLSLTNRSGTDIRLFWLDHAGRRVPNGTVEKDGSMYVSTPIARPLVITDASEQCHEIILPGETTRFHVVEPSGAPAIRRTAPIPGSEEALQRHIEGVRHGTPDYERMTPRTAAATRRLLPQEQAILARLGTLRAMSFRGVSQAGNDIYTVQFANGWAEWQIGLIDQGRIASLMLGPQY